MSLPALEEHVNLLISDLIDFCRQLEEQVVALEDRVAKYDSWYEDDHK